MEIRNITLNFEEGNIKGIFLSSVLDGIYLKLFQNARRGGKRNPSDIEHGIKLVVFGCFLLETRVNEEIRFITRHETKEKQFSSTLWKTLRKRNLLEKLKLISSLSTQKQQERYDLLRPKVKEVFDLRNRLAHFKDEPEQHAENSTLEEAIEFFQNLPIPDLNRKLMWEETKHIAETISYTIKWLNNFHSSYCAKKKVKVTKETQV